MAVLSFSLVTAVALTCAMFATREIMLGWPSTIFWALVTGVSYTKTTAHAWTDPYYWLFWAGIAMIFLCALGMYALRETKNSEPEKFVDEGKEPESADDGDDSLESPSQPSRRVIKIRDRAQKRRTGGTGGKTGWGEFR